MKYRPKKVFVLECGEYTEVSYEEFCIEKKADNESQESRYIMIQGMLLEVKEAEYKAHYKICRRMRYISEIEQEIQILSFEECMDAGLERIMIFPSKDETPEKIAEENDLMKKLRIAISKLSCEERYMILSHFFFNNTQEETAKRLCISQSAVSQRMRRILDKLRKELE